MTKWRSKLPFNQKSFFIEFEKVLTKVRQGWWRT